MLTVDRKHLHPITSNNNYSSIKQISGVEPSVLSLIKNELLGVLAANCKIDPPEIQEFLIVFSRKSKLKAQQAYATFPLNFLNE